MHLGIDVGSVAAKVALFVPDGAPWPSDGARATFLFPSPLSVRGGVVFLLGADRVMGDPSRVVVDEKASWESRLGTACAVALTGRFGRAIAGAESLRFENEVRCIAEGAYVLHPGVRTVFDMGGESSRVVRFDGASGGVRPRVREVDANGDCAAGTGSFIDQQASRMLFSPEEAGALAASAGSAARIAGRCSVFAKSDMIHAQQKGFSPEEILRGLCEAVARNFKANVNRGKAVEGPVLLAGGLFANEGVLRAVRDAFGLTAETGVRPHGFAFGGAIGAALLSAASVGQRRVAPSRTARKRSDDSVARAMPPLSMNDVLLLRDRVLPPSVGDGVRELFLGIDIGSVSTNFALVDVEGRLVREVYVRTDSRPVQVVTKGLLDIAAEFGGSLRIRGVGTTGSGRELIGELVGADAINDEITAHKTGASFLASTCLGRPVDAIFEIGGQDSKFIALDGGVVVDFAMNDACAAGTGSFLEEQAERLGVSIKGEFASMALSSSAPSGLGERCTVFMEDDVAAALRRGERREDIVAGLAYSVAVNYLNRVVRGRPIGETVFFQGGTAYNDAVAAAFSTLLGRQVVVPPHNGVVGAIGMALLARDKVIATGEATRFRGFDLSCVGFARREFVCRGCGNECEMQEVAIEGSKSYWGDKCSDRYRKPARVDTVPVVSDLFARRAAHLDAMADAVVPGRRGTVGIPRAMYFHERFPYWKAFLESIGFSVVASRRTDKAIAREGTERSVAEPCYPVQVAHGHIGALLSAGVDFVFVPNPIEAETTHRHTASHFCLWGQTLPFVVASVPAWEESLRAKLISPTVVFRDGEKHVVADLYEAFRRFGVSRDEVRAGVGEAVDAQAKFDRFLVAEGEAAVRATVDAGAHAVILVGRPYNLHDRDVNLDLPAKLRSRYGANVIPVDMLPVDDICVRDVNENMYWSFGRKILAAARFASRHPRFHIVHVTNFKCGPDSFVRHWIAEAAGSPFLTLQFDGHGNDAGYMTRCEAYLDSKGVLRAWAGV